MPAAKAIPPQEPGITEEELKQMLVGKPLYLRGGYLDNSLSFSEHGTLIGHSPQGSYTLSAIEIDRVRLTKHKVELEGARYGLHFLGALPYEDPTKALDRVKITPKKKVVRITIDRELVVTPKKKKENEKGKDLKAKSGTPAPKPAAAVTPTESAVAAPQTAAAAAQATAPAEQAAATPAAPTPASGTPAPKEMSAEDEAKAEMAAAPAEERPADPSSVTTTLSPAHATKVLKDALDKMFAPGLDDRMMTAMPDFWKLYYQAVAAKNDYRPADPNVLRQNTVDKKAMLITKFEPESNEWAQASGIAGPALYHAVIGADGRPSEIAVARPIGFGLDENAVAAIRNASFEPAIKDGKPVPVMLDLYVSFRIYSKRTSVASKQDAADKGTTPQLPGPYTVRDHP
jgi:TonB family protein